MWGEIFQGFTLAEVVSVWYHLVCEPLRKTSPRECICLNLWFRREPKCDNSSPANAQPVSTGWWLPLGIFPNTTLIPFWDMISRINSHLSLASCAYDRWSHGKWCYTLTRCSPDVLS